MACPSDYMRSVELHREAAAQSVSHRGSISCCSHTWAPVGDERVAGIDPEPWGCRPTVPPYLLGPGQLGPVACSRLQLVVAAGSQELAID